MPKRSGEARRKGVDRRRMLRPLHVFFYIIGVVVTLIVLGLLIISLLNNGRPPVTIRTVPAQIDDTLSPEEVLRLVNVERKSHRLRELKEDKRLTHIAWARANDMVNRQYYAHLNPDGKYYYDLFPAFNIKSKYSCENLDVQFTVDEHAYIQDWLNSQTHRDCMLHKDATSAGYAVVRFSKPSEYPIYIVVGIHSTNISNLQATQ